jgi:hypothetical protein
VRDQIDDHEFERIEPIPPGAGGAYRLVFEWH